MVYNISLSNLVCHVRNKDVDNIFYNSKKEDKAKLLMLDGLLDSSRETIKKVGLWVWLRHHNESMESLCKYFTKVLNTMKPITLIRITDM